MYKDIELIILDFDGIISKDFIIDQTGYVQKSIYPGHSQAIEAMKKYCRVVVMTGSKDKTSRRMTYDYCNKLGIDYYVSDDKINSIMAQGWWNSKTLYFGDDFDDIKLAVLSKSDSFPGPIIAGIDEVNVHIVDTLFKPPMHLTNLADKITTSKSEMGADYVNQISYKNAVLQSLGNREQIIIHQQYSMRSYIDSVYDISCDGNLALTLSMIHEIHKEKDIQFYITCPMNAKNIPRIDGVTFMNIEYGENAKENRTKANFYIGAKKKSLVISYFPNLITSLLIDTKVIYMCEVSPKEEDIIDNKTRNRIHENLQIANTAFILNENQYSFLSSLNTNTEIYRITNTVSASRIISNAIVSGDDYNKAKKIIQDTDLYFPYRISDPEYNFEKVRKNPEFNLILLTDPNDSYDKETLRPERMPKSVFNRCVHGMILNNELPCKIYYGGDQTKVFHSTTVEYFALFEKNDRIKAMDMFTWPKGIDKVKQLEIINELIEEE